MITVDPTDERAVAIAEKLEHSIPARYHVESKTMFLHPESYDAVMKEHMAEGAMKSPVETVTFTKMVSEV